MPLPLGRGRRATSDAGTRLPCGAAPAKYLITMASPVLAAVDPGTVDLAPVRFAARVAAHTGAPLMIAAVFASDDEVDRLIGGQLGEELPRDASGALKRAVEAVRDGGVGAAVFGSVDALALGASSAPRGLAFAALEVGAALVVVGSPAGGAAGRTGVGSTAARLLDGAPSAVAVVPAGWEDDGDWTTVGAGFVASVEGRAATAGAQVLARRAGARLRVLAAVQPRAWMEGAGGDVAADLRARVEEAGGAQMARLPGVAVDVDVQEGEPADVLLAATDDDLDLLVCGARGYGPERSALLGGVTRRVTTGAACPVIVLARGPGVTLESLVD
jgi:nucleotide-binding universal stress UspA family protein